MQAQIEIGFDQLVQLVKELPVKQWIKLKKEVEEEQVVSGDAGLLAFLLTAPTFNEKQLEKIAQTRKEISEWRKD